MAYTPEGVTRDRVFRFVQRRLLQGRPPTMREIQEAMGFKAVQTVKQHLIRLVEEGRLLQEPGKSRSLRLPGSAHAYGVRLIPLIGRVQAGKLQPAVEDPEGYVAVNPRNDDHMFALRVRGTSMNGAGILPGDIVIVRSQDTAHSGDIVVALVEDEATVKTLRMKKGKIHLQPANPDFETIAPENCKILGKVVEIRRVLEGGVS